MIYFTFSGIFAKLFFMKNKTQTDVQQKKSKVKTNNASNFKTRYFDFYDDIKDPTHKIVDW